MLRLTDIGGQTFLLNPDHIITVHELAEGGSRIALDNGTSVMVKDSISEMGAWLT